MARRSIFDVKSQSAELFQIRIKDKGSGLNPTVELLIEDEDWTCDCGAKEDPCIHVLASSIAIKRNLDAGMPLPKLNTEDVIIKYEWTEEKNRIRLKRYLYTVSADGTDLSHEELKVSLISLTHGLKGRSDLAPSKWDLEVDQLLSQMKDTGNSFRARKKLLQLMERLDHTQFIGKVSEVKASCDALELILVEDSSGLCAHLKQRSSDAKLYSNGFSLSQGTLSLLPENEFLAELAPFKEKYFVREEHRASFLGDTIPRFKKWITVIDEGLKKAEYQRMTVKLETSETQFGVQVTPRIFYGEPPSAVVKNDQIHLLDKGSELPLRRLDDERRMRDQLWQEKSLSLNDAVEFSTKSDFMKLSEAKYLGLDVVGVDLSCYQFQGSLSFKLDMESGEPSAYFVAPNKREVRLSVGEVLTRYESRESLIKLDQVGLVELPLSFIKKNLHLLSDLATNSSQSKVDKLRAFHAACEIDRSDVWQEKLHTYRSEHFLTSPVDLSEIKAQLRDYQMEGVQWLHQLSESGFGGILADDMGLGKTLQAISVIKAPTLIVCPTSLLANWKAELQKFRPSLKAQVYHGTNRKIQTDSEVVITSYGVFRKDQSAFAIKSWRMLIVDESQNAKNPKSKLAVALQSFKADNKFCLSGTPIENSLEDLWSQMEVANPGYLGPLARYRKNYCTGGVPTSHERLEFLKTKIKPFLMRRMKSEVAKDLPPKTLTTRLVQFSDADTVCYQKYLQLVRSEVSEVLDASEKLKVPELLTILMRLRQICNHPGLVDKDLMSSESSKTEYLISNLQKVIAAGHKALVISQWTSYLDIVEDKLASHQLSFLRLDGQTKNRDRVVESFQSDDSVKVLLLSLKAGGVGLNLTAADYVFHTDPWWNPAAERQATDRVYRIGQDKPVFIEKLITKGTIEERIIELQKRKERLSQHMVEGLDASQIDFSKDDILSLIM